MNFYKKIIALLIVVLVTASLTMAYSDRIFEGNVLVASQQPASAKKTAPTAEDKKEMVLVDMEADVIQKRGAFDSTVYLVGNVKFHHNGAIIECDSASRYDEHRMDFFGRVIINKDSALVYGDKVSYDGRTAIAEVFAPIVKMLRGDVTMYSYNLKFNTKTNVAIYSGGGIMNQKDNFMESERGEYNADLNIIKFIDSVNMRSDSYLIRTDSLDYNLDTETAIFLDRTIVWDKDSSILTANRGFYFNAKKTYEFVSDAYILTKEQEMWADTMNYFQPMRQATMFGNVQILDTTQRTIALSDWAYYDDSLGNAVLTRRPSLRSYDSEHKDTTYMRADSIFMDTYAPGVGPRAYMDSMAMSDDSMAMDSLPQVDSVRNVIADSLPIVDSAQNVIAGLTRNLPIFDSLLSIDSLPEVDSVHNVIAGLTRNLPIADSLLSIDSLPEVDSVHNVIAGLPRNLPIADSLSPLTDSLFAVDSLSRSDSTLNDSLKIEKVPQKERVIRAYHRVRSWAKDYQGICDSMVSFSVDSMASMFGRPIMWSQANQISADRIDTYTADEEMDWVDFIGSPFITQQLEPTWPEPADTARFNQAAGREMQAYFKNNEIDSAVMSGNVINYYYYMDAEGYTAAFATVTCPELVIFFENREPSVMRWQGNTNFEIFPLEQIPVDNTQRLEGFQWDPDKRPMSAKEISDRELRDSRRAFIEKVDKPGFSIEKQMEQYKTRMLENKLWTDRSEFTTTTPEYFERQNMML